MNHHYTQKLSDLFRCFNQGDYAAEAFTTHEYLARLKRHEDTPNARSDRQRVRSLLEPHPGLKVLDYGCGLGGLCAELAAEGCAVDGADASPTILAAARSRHPDLRFFGIEEIRETYDAVVSVHVLGVVPDARQTLAAMRDALRPGGALVFCVPNPAYTFGMIPDNLVNHYLPDTTVTRCWSRSRMASELRASGFRVEAIGTFGEFPTLFPLSAMRSRLTGKAIKC